MSRYTKKNSPTMIQELIGFFGSFRYAMEGLAHAFREHISFRFQLIVGCLVIMMGIMLGINRYEWMVLCVFVGLILAAELLNTAIETTLDYLAKDHHIDVKIAKDVSAAGVLVLSISAIAAGLIIFLPRILS